MGAGQTMLPIPFLRQLIRFYGDSIGKMVPSYLQVSLDTLTRDQVRVREHITSAFSPQGALEAYHEQARKNLAMFEQAMSMFSPFGPGAAQKAPGATSTTAEPTAPGAAAHIVPMPTPAFGSFVAPTNKGSEQVVNVTAKDIAPKPGNDQLAEMQTQLSAMQAMIDKLAKDNK